MKEPGPSLPGVWQGIGEINKAVKASGLPEDTFELVHVRVSQVNGCSASPRPGRPRAPCVDRAPGHSGRWRDAPYFTAAERAALALAEAATRLRRHLHPVPDAIWDEAARYHDEQAMAGLVLAIAMTNLFNRLNRVTRQWPAGFVLRAQQHPIRTGACLHARR